MKPVVFHEQARAELDAAVAHYERQKEGLGIDFKLEVKRAVARIQAQPQAGSQYKSTAFRFWLVHRFPYVVYYTVMSDFVWIAAVAHASRRPGYWRRRQP